MTSTLITGIAFVSNASSNVYAASILEVEPNDTIETAQPISLNGEIKGNISKVYKEPTNEDYLKITVSQDGILNLKMDKSESFENKIQVLDSEKNIIMDRKVGFTKNLEDSINLGKGEYYIRLYLEYNADGNKSYDYNLITSFKPYTASYRGETEYNDTIERADLIAVNTTYHGSLLKSNHSGDDLDNFKVSIPKDTYTSINLQFDTPFWRVSLLDANGNKIQSDYSQGRKDTHTIDGQFKAGDYYISVDTYSSGNLNYSIRADISEVKSFKDIAKNHKFYNEISMVRELGIINGYTDGNFSPNEKIKRKHVAAMINRAGATLTPIRKMTYFSDLRVTDSAYDSIEKLYEAGVIDGNGKNFNPENSLTHAQIAKILVNAFGLEKNSDKVYSFSDVKKSTWYYDYVQILAENGATLNSKGKFNPNSPVTRAELAVLISRTIEASKNISL